MFLDALDFLISVKVNLPKLNYLDRYFEDISRIHIKERNVLRSQALQ